MNERGILLAFRIHYSPLCHTMQSHICARMALPQSCTEQVTDVSNIFQFRECDNIASFQPLSRFCFVIFRSFLHVLVDLWTGVYMESFHIAARTVTRARTYLSDNFFCIWFARCWYNLCLCILYIVVAHFNAFTFAMDATSVISVHMSGSGLQFFFSRKENICWGRRRAREWSINAFGCHVPCVCRCRLHKIYDSCCLLLYHSCAGCCRNLIMIRFCVEETPRSVDIVTNLIKSQNEMEQ